MRPVRALFKSAMIVYHMIGLASLAAAVLALGCWMVPGLSRVQSPIAWIALAPALYFAWLVLMLAASALNMQIIHRLGWRKPRRFESEPNAADTREAVLVYAVMLRALMIWSLPGARYLLRIPLLDRLVLHSYSPVVPVGQNAQVWGLIYDPDLTVIGERAVIGGDATLSAHAVTTRSDGGLVYTTAPISVGARAVIGANSRVALGADIGHDAIVLPGSNVLPFTRVPANQVWGGNPAVFVRIRTESETGDAERSDQAAAPLSAPEPTSLRLHRACDERLVDEVRALVAHALALPAERVTPEFCSCDCAEWDSLGQMAIAAAIYNRFGLAVESNNMFSLRSVVDLCKFVGNQTNRDAQSSPVIEGIPGNPEFLPLLETSVATRLLAEQAAVDGTPIAHEIKVAVAATFTADQLGPALSLWGRAFGIRVKTRWAGFDRVRESLLDPESLLRTNPGVNIVLARPEDLLRENDADTDAFVDALLAAAETCARESAGRLVVATLPPVVSELQTFDPDRVNRVRAKWNARIAATSEFEVIDLAGAVERLGATAVRASAMEIQTRSPYAPSLYQELAREAARLLRKRFRPAAKVLALDADNTLWKGVVAEDGPEGIQIGADHPGRAFQLFQQAALQLRERGVLLAIVSRNEPEDVWTVFDQHPGMLLRRSHVTASRINWQPKSQNLRELAAELNLGLDSFVFVDDDPAVRQEVAANAPEVLVVPMPQDPAEYCRMLTRLWVFDSSAVTAEDRQRAAMMKQEEKRQQLRARRSDLVEYLRDLDLSVTMREATHFDLARVAQLEQKTNQFNLSLARRGADEIKSLSRRHPIYVVEASDRFGDYGLVGACVVAQAEDDRELFTLDTLILSCRSLGRGVEDAVLCGILREVRARDGRRLQAAFVPGPRNAPVRDFLLRSGFAERSENHFSIDASVERPFPEHVTWVTNRSRLAG